MSSNKVKNLYQLNKVRKTAYFNTMDYKHLEEPFLELLMNNDKNYDDSLDENMTLQQTSKQTLETKDKIEDKQEVKLSLHSRSQSCPYITPDIQENIKNQQAQQFQQGKLRQPRYSLNKDMNSPQGKKIRKLNNIILPFAKRSQPRNSTMSSQSVVIHNNQDSSQAISCMLLSQKKNTPQVKKTIQKVSRKLIQNVNQDSWRKVKYLKIKLQQQIKKYELNHDLKKLQKQTNDINIKQVIFQNMLRKSEAQNKYLNLQTNQSFILQQCL